MQSFDARGGAYLLLVDTGRAPPAQWAGAARRAEVYWQASQPGSSMAQNFTSVAGAAGAAVLGAAAWPDDTAFKRPLCTVDFSACVALLVRR